jgi:hypothetical protein
MEQNDQIQCEFVRRMNLDDIINQIEGLSVEEKLELMRKLSTTKNEGLTFILGSNNVINSSFAIQINKGADEMSEQLKDLPTETLQELLRAIAIRIVQDK